MKKTKKFLLSMKGNGSVVCDDKEEALYHICALDELDIGDEFTLKVAEFSDDDLAKLTEFDGF